MTTNKSDSSLAFVFPGQGSQAIGMLGDIGRSRPEIKKTFDEASEALGFDLWDLVQNGPEAELNETQNTQPAMLAAGVAVWRVWQTVGPRPALMAGHSLGEYTALTCAGALDFATSIAVVAERARLMQEAVPAGQGAMAAVLGLEDQVVMEVCKQAAQGEVVAAVNFNAPGQVVIAGTVSAVERAVTLSKERGAKRAVSLPVSVPAHCELMRPAAEQLAVRLRQIDLRVPEIPVIQNADVKIHDSPASIGDALVRQLYLPVRWVESVQTLAQREVTTIVECGPGKVLAGLNKRIDKGITALSLFDETSLLAVLNAVKGGIT